MDDSTVAKDRFDYARILVATSSLDVINFTDRIIIDGVLVELKIIVEWGFAIGEDAYLLEENDDGANAYILDNNFEHVEPEIRDQVVDLVNNLADDCINEDKEAHCKSPPKAPSRVEELVGKVYSTSDSTASDESKHVVVVVPL